MSMTSADRCHACGTPLDGTVRFCGHCGTPRAPKAPAPTNGAPQRHTNVAGGDIVHDYGTHIGTQVINVNHRGHADDREEYKARFRAMLEGIRRTRDWMTTEERGLLDQTAAQLKLPAWDRQDCEVEVLQAMRFELRARPTEFWSVTVSGRSEPLAKNIERRSAVDSLAEYLDAYSPAQLFLWRKEFGSRWKRLSEEPELLHETLARRRDRFQELLLDWARRGQPTESLVRLEEAKAHLANKDAETARRSAERQFGRPITLALSSPSVVLKSSSEPALEGEYEGASDQNVRLRISEDGVSLKTYYPIVKAGHARIVGRTRDRNEFSLALGEQQGQLPLLEGIDGSVTADGIVITLVRGPNSKELDAFKTAYRRI